MDWQTFWDQQAQASNPNEQVGRMLGGQPLGGAVLDRLTGHVVQLLDLQAGDELLDVCCGNGLLTARLAQRCRRVVGVDLSGEQVARARSQHRLPNLEFLQGDATRLSDTVNDRFDKISLFFSFQYLDRYALGKAAIAGMLDLLQPGGRIAIGDVTDRKYLHRFYPTRQARLRYHLQRLLGRNDMGKFWSEKEIKRICRQLGARCERREQPHDLPYSHYRCDYLIYH